MTDKPFGANIILARTLEGQVEACLDEAPPLIVFSGETRHLTSATRTIRGARCSFRLGQ